MVPLYSNVVQLHIICLKSNQAYWQTKEEEMSRWHSYSLRVYTSVSVHIHDHVYGYMCQFNVYVLHICS